MDNNFEIKHGYRGIIIEKDEMTFRVEKGIDGDIWFSSANSDIKLPISFYSDYQEEWESYVIFENLMKSIVGRYILNGDDKEKYGILPRDFVNLENKTITWHSDGETDDKLQLQFGEKEIIVSIIRDENTRNQNYNKVIKVRIRTSGSSYEYYYQEFERFFDDLSSFAYQVEAMNEREVPTNEAKNPFQKNLSLSDKLKK